MISSKMLQGVQQKETFDVINDSLDILSEVLAKFGHLLLDQHAAIVQTLLPYLDDSRHGIRKRALHCIGALAPFLSDPQLDAVVQHNLSQLQGGKLKPDNARSYVQGVGMLSRAVGYRFGRHFQAAVPLVIKYAQQAAEGDDELREFALQALESFVARSPGDARPYLDQLLFEALKYLKYDPNYAVDEMSDDAENGGGSDDEADADASDEEEYSDDDDLSWKVRRAAAKLVSAVVHAYPDQLGEVYSKAAGELVSRFKEREESVKADIFTAYSDMLRQVAIVSSHYAENAPANPLQLLRNDVGTVLRAAAKQLSDRSPKTRMGMFTVLRTLVGVLPASVAEHVGMLVPGILLACKDKSASSSSLKIEALTFLRSAMESNSPAVFQLHVQQLSTGVFAAVGERYYKVAAEALRVCEQMVSVVRSDLSAPVPDNLTQLVQDMFRCINSRLAAQDQDQEVKECAILCMAHLVATCGDLLSAEVPGVLKLLLDRLRNEITRLPAVKALAILAHSQLQLGMEAALEPITGELTSFLRKANRLLRQASLQALDALIAKHGAALDATSTSAVITEASALISDADLSIAALSLKVFVTLTSKQPQSAQEVVEKALPAALTLVKSPLLQVGAAADLHCRQLLLQCVVEQQSFNGHPR
eukprot:GHRR01008035.1.p1 GENE.GHRR01008035.1~~GHRR01008035.1.p1  ORF type:complete len:648 (+),score=253.35 GHRR01008035.1:1250-3193(+)